MTDRVVVLEDDLADQRFLDRAAQRCGLDVELVMCADLFIARDQIEAAEPDLVIVDLSVPGGHGVNLIEQLKADRPMLPTVVLTSSTAPWDHRAAIDAGARAVHTKPFEWDAYRDLVDRMLRYWLGR